MKRRLVTAAIALTTLITVLVATPNQAQAHYVGTYTVLSTTAGYPWPSFDGDGGCHQGYVCDWSGNLLTGWGVGFYSDKWDYAAADVPKNGSISINNNAESFVNWGFVGSFDRVKFYNFAGGTGYLGCIAAGYGFQNTSGTGLVNTVSAHAWYSSC